MQINFKPHWKELFRAKYRHLLYFGGRGGGKSQTVARALILRATKQKLLILCAREKQNSINDSVYSLLKNIVEEYSQQGIFAQGFIQIKLDEIVFANGSKFIFKGLSNLTMANIKSLEGVDICWCEEASSLSVKTIDVLLPTIRKDNSQIIFTYNRNTLFDPIHVKLATNVDENTFIKKVNWNDNEYFPEVLENERLRCLKTEPDYIYNHIWEGEPHSDEHLLIHSKDLVKSISHVSLTYHNFRYRIGVDVARSGNDSSVIIARRGDKILEILKFKGLDGQQLANQISLVANKFSNYTIFIDSIGVGASPCDFLRVMKIPYIPVNFSESADEIRHFNKRSECYNRLAEAVKQGLEFCLGSEGLKTQLSYIPIDLGSEKIKVKKKEFIREKLGGSPDEADALAVTYATMSNDLLNNSNQTFYSKVQTKTQFTNEELTKIW